MLELISARFGRFFSKQLTLFVALSFTTIGTCLASEQQPPIKGRFQDLGHHHFKITTRSSAAQRAFDRGLTLAYAFSHHRAEKEFRLAVDADPECAMAWWGIALVNGPHINFPLVPPANAKIAWDALTKAKQLAPRTNSLEQALIGALAKRYANPQPADRSFLDRAYARAMRDVWVAYPNNADIGALYAESLMDLHPWNLWKPDGSPQPWTPEIVTTLERVLVIDPKHAGANHFYIHAVESSSQPGRATRAANRLRALVPGASHLVHMPSHIFARTGRWKDAAQANIDAMKVDNSYRSVFPRPGFYALYMAHNTHFLAFTAMMRGRYEEAIFNGRAMVASVPPDFLREYAASADGFMIFPSEVLMRFGKWQEILNEPKPHSGLPLSISLWHYTRAAALTALNRPKQAQRERVAFRKAAPLVPTHWKKGNNSAADILAIASLVLDGEFLAKEGRYNEAVASLSEAARREDKLIYDEPPDWIQPVRHTLGAVLLRAGRSHEAEQVYREDLVRYPGNGWALFGLARSLDQQVNKRTAAREAWRGFQKAWAKADTKLDSTCFCQAEA